MKRSEKVLLLITSSVFLSGCNQRSPEPTGADWSSSDSPTSGQIEGGTQNSSGTQGSARYGSGVSIRPGFYGSSAGSSSSSHSSGESASSGTSRGGFGGHGGGGGE